MSSNCRIMMPLTYSISNGILLGMIAYVLINLVCRNFRKLSPTMYILAILFIRNSTRYSDFLNMTLLVMIKLTSPDTHMAARLQITTSHPKNLSMIRRIQNLSRKTAEHDRL